MKTRIAICDLCISDGEVIAAEGTYTTDEGGEFHACEEHLEECEGYGFSIKKFPRKGDIEPGIL